ncbi:MAG: 3-oxoacyl-[acyl-carrier-protein] reductase [Eubacterium sp.]|nr:3-oxoacyl-[acyl-carrier-protein] reductase [Eubacterium sp.]
MLTDKIALVTGAGRGIGRAVAKMLASQGAYVYLNYHGSEAAAQEAAAEILKSGGKAEAVQCDVSDFKACGEMIQTIIQKSGRLDILVNNAGITRDGLLMKMSEEDYDKVLDINLKGTFHTIRHASRYLLKQRSGRIINITSVSGVLGNAGQANYSASKAGVIGLTKSAARELASRGICVNAVAPGYVKTDMTDALPDQVKEQMLSQIPLGRAADPEEIAGVVLFLASEQSAYMTGQVLCVDGGMAM